MVILTSDSLQEVPPLLTSDHSSTQRLLLSSSPFSWFLYPMSCTETHPCPILLSHLSRFLSLFISGGFSNHLGPVGLSFHFRPLKFLLSSPTSDWRATKSKYVVTLLYEVFWGGVVFVWYGPLVSCYIETRKWVTNFESVIPKRTVKFLIYLCL